VLLRAIRDAELSNRICPEKCSISTGFLRKYAPEDTVRERELLERDERTFTLCAAADLSFGTRGGEEGDEEEEGRRETASVRKSERRRRVCKRDIIAKRGGGRRD
jgi:hypothetical protein